MSDEQLLGYLFDALEPAEQETIEHQLEGDPGSQARLEDLRRVATILGEDDRIEPPIGLAGSTLDLIRKQDLAASRQEWAEPPSRLRALDFAVAVSVLSIAAVMVFPAIATLRGDQARLLCADRLRQIGTAINAYADFEGGNLPFVDPSGPLNHAGIYAMALKARDMIPEVKVLVCPSANSAMVQVPDQVQFLAALDEPLRAAQLRRHMGGSYGYLLGFIDGGRFAGYEKSNRLRADQQAVASDRPPRHDEMLASMNSPNHQGAGQNVLYADGNIRWLPTPKFGQDNLFLNNGCTVGAGFNMRDTVIGVSEATPFPQNWQAMP